jgi:agmatine deiminase
MNIKNYQMPGEWEIHERTIMEWPVKDALVFPENYQEVAKSYAEVANAIAEFEPVTLLVHEHTFEEAKHVCNKNVELLILPHNDAWCRDNGPTFVWNKEKELAGIDWMFNAWGERFKPYDLDNQVAAKILKKLNIPYVSADFVLEGGSIHVDGEGTLLTTKECLLNSNRNPLLSQTDIEARLINYLGIQTVIWLNRGLFGDETDGHVDNVACFVKPGVVLIQACHDPSNPNYDYSQENLNILKEAKDAKGRSLQIVELPQPPRRYYEGVELTLSYLNYYLVNGGLILPIFGKDAANCDQEVIRILTELYPERKIVTVDGMGLIKEGGNVHCITQQMPKGNN